VGCFITQLLRQNHHRWSQQDGMGPYGAHHASGKVLVPATLYLGSKYGETFLWTLVGDSSVSEGVCGWNWHGPIRSSPCL